MNIDNINTALIIIAFILAYILPFELFVIVYAILGPLHYLTEINWIKDKKYFLSWKKWSYLCLTMALIVSIPLLLKLNFVKDLVGDRLSHIIFQNSIFTNGAIFLCFAAGIIFMQPIKNWMKIVLLLLSGVLGVLSTNIESFNALFGIFIPTIIHVYFFTLLFMWYGTIKKKTKLGFANVFLLMIAPVFIFFIPDPIWGLPSQNVQDIYVENKFYMLNVILSEMIGVSDGTVFNFSDFITTKVQMFISFAYTYHYLNWFSKTGVIGWHKNLNNYKIIVILFLWFLSVALYAYNYRLGLMLLLFLSYLHVFLEFPINIISIREIVRYYKEKL